MAFGKVFKKIGRGLVGGGLGFLTGGPVGGMLGAAGGLFGGKKAISGEEPSQGVTDVRSPAERALAESQAKYFQGQMDKPDFGFQADEAGRKIRVGQRSERLREGIAGYAADKGFGMLQHGPSVSTYGKGLQAIEEGEAAGEEERRQAHKQFILSGGRTAATPTGRTPYNIPGSPGFAGLAGQMMGSPAGADQMGTNFGKLIGFGKKFLGGGPASYSGLSDRLRGPY